MQIREIQLPSGSVLKVQPATFSESKNLYQAVLRDAKHLQFDAETEIGLSFLKDMFCTALSSNEIEKALEPCLKKALYNDLAISVKTFEPVEARQDYIQVMFEVAKENILPFLPKDIYAKLSEVAKKLDKDLISQKSA